MSRRIRLLPQVGSRWFSLALLAATVLMVLAVLAGATGAADAGSPSEQRKFKSQFQGKFDSSALASGVAVPTDAGFGETAIAVHKCDFSFFSAGGTATAGVQALAQDGSTSAFETEVDAAKTAGNALKFWKIGVPGGPTGNKNGPNSIPVDEDFSCLTVLVKINPTSDWFAGVSAHDLRAGGTWPTPGNNNNIFIDLFPFDAGTLDGTEFVASSTATSPQGTIASLRNSGKFSDNRIVQLKLTLKNPALTRDVAAEAGIESITVTWREVVAAGGYHVMWKSGAETYDTNGSLGRRDVVVGGKTLAHTITGLTGGVEYDVQVVAYNEAGPSTNDPTYESKDSATPSSADNTVLVGNSTQLLPGTERLTIGTGAQFTARAQAFTTGSAPAVLGSVTLPNFRKENNNSVVDVHIYSASGVDPDAELYTLTRPDFSSFSSGVPADITFNAAAADTITLAINTTYFVVVEAVQAEVGLAHTKDDDEDQATDEGWSIANTCRREHRDGTPNSDCERTGSNTAALIMVLNSPLEADKPVFSISGSEAVEGTGIQFTVSLSPALGEEVTVEYSTADDSATTADSDYTAVTAMTLTFAANETEKTVTIATTADSTDEDDENFNVVLSSSSDNAQLGYVTSASGLIINNDQTTQTDGTLSSITLTGSDGNTIALTPAFGQYKFLYTATANRELDFLTGVAVPNTTGTVQSIMYINGDEDTDTTAYDAVWPLVPGDTLVKFMVTSPDGSQVKFYKIHVEKDAATDATLESLSLVDSTTSNPVAVTLSPAFDPATTAYTASVGADVTSVTLTGIQNHNGATISNDRGPVLMSGEATVGPWAGESVINIDLTAEDGSTAKTYTVTATRILTVNFDSATYSVNEGESVTVSVSLDGVPGNEVRADLSTTLQGATTADFGGVPEYVTFAGTDLIKTFDFVALTDIPSDPGETVTIGLGPNSMYPGLASGTNGSTIVSIGDIVTQQLVAVDFGQSTYSVNEGASVEITIRLATAPSGPVTIPLTITPEGGATSSEYSVPSSVTFQSGHNSQTISFSATLDADTDPGESVKIELGTLPTGYAAGATTATTVSINSRSVVVNFGAASYDVEENEDVEIAVTLSPALGSEVTIPLTATGKGGATSTDYTLPTPTSVTFLVGETGKTIIFTPVNDTYDDDDEFVEIEFGTLPDGIASGTTDKATVNILDDDHPIIQLSFSSGAYEVTEGSDMELTLELTAPPERSISIRMQVYPQGNATIDDVSIAPTTIGFGANQDSATFVFTASPDTINEDNDVIKLEPDLGLPGGVGLGTYFASFVTIIDDDDPSVTVSFDQSSYTVAESDDLTTSPAQEHKVTFKVKLSADPERTVVIPVYATVQGGASSTDYSIVPTVSTMPATPTILTFNAGDTEKSFTFTATDDALNDDGEAVLLRIGTISDTGVTLGDYGQATVSIIDDDDPPVTVSFELDAYSVAEGGSVDVKVKLSADPERSVVIPILATAQLSGSSAVFSVPMNVTFASTETSKTITFNSTQDTFNNDGETVKLSFGLPDAGAVGVTAAGTTEALVSITDDDVPEVTVWFELDEYTVAESDNPDTPEKENEATVKVLLSADPERQVVIQIGTLGELGAGFADYSGVPSSLTFNTLNNGEKEKTFTFSALPDGENDDGEKVRLNIFPPPAGVTWASPSITYVYITDDDDPPVKVSISSSVPTVTEGATATITVSLDADPEREVIIPITKTHHGGAVENDDYSGVPDSVTFTDGGLTTQSFTFQAVDDTDDDDGESVTFGFGMLPDGVTAVDTADDVTIGITDNDVPEVNVYFEHDTYSAIENSSVTVKLKLSVAPERNLTIELAPENLGGTLDADYSGIPANVAFSPTDTEKTFTFTATDDSTDDDGESVKITLETTDARVSFGDTNGDNAITTINITDDDYPTLTVNFEESSYTVAESNDTSTPETENEVTVTVKLSAPPERQVTINFPISTDSTASSGDYTTVTSVTFEENEDEQTFSFTANHDTDDEDDESVTFGFSTSLPTGISAGATAETVVSITDDDLPNVTVYFDQSSYDAPEGGAISVLVKLSEEPQREITIPLTATPQDGAMEGDDYTALVTSVTFGATDTSKTISFNAVDDTESDDDESVKITFGSLPDGVSAASPSETTVTIIDNIVDVVAEFEEITYTAAEGTMVTIKVKLDEDPERMISIPLTVIGGGGEPGETGATTDDYSGFPASVNFSPGDTEKEFRFTVDSDDVDDDLESLLIEFGTLPTGVTAGTNGSTTVNITDDDVPDVDVMFGAATYTATEGEPATVVTVELSADPERMLEIPLTASVLDGASPADYELPTPASVTFIAGDVSPKTFEFLAVDDTDDDDGERVKLGFGAMPDDRVEAGNPAETTVTITDDDDPVVKVSFSHAEHTVAEGAMVDLTVSVDVDPERDLIIPLSPEYVGGATDADHSVVPPSVMLSTDKRFETITFAATPDSDDDDEDQVIIGFGTMPDPRVSAGDVPSTEISITDDDDPQVTVMFGAAT